MPRKKAEETATGITTERYVVHNMFGQMVANGVTHTAEEIADMKAAGYKVEKFKEERK